MRRERLYGLDILRTLGTFIIVFHHLPDYVGNFYDLNCFGIPLNLSYVNVLNTYFGLGIFVFVSGFVLDYTSPEVDRPWSFLRTRAVRIFPLYLVALALFILTLRRLSLPETLIHIFGLQILLAPRFVNPVPTLWFVGLIFQFYVLYALLAKHTRDHWGVVVFSLTVFGGLFLVRYFFNVVEYRFFLYYFIFLSGIMCCRASLFTRHNFGVMHLLVAILILFGSVVVFHSFNEGPIYEYGGVTEAFVSEASIAELIVVSAAVDLIMLAFVFIAFTIASKLKRHLNEATTRLLSFFSFSSYGVYLFHRPILDLITEMVDPLFAHHSGWRLLLGVVVGLPLVFSLSYIAQAVCSRAVGQLRARR